MKAEDIETALHAKPFLPFELRIDGETLVVRHPEQVFLAGHKSTLIFDDGERIHIMDCGLISKLALLRKKNGKH